MKDLTKKNQDKPTLISLCTDMHMPILVYFWTYIFLVFFIFFSRFPLTVHSLLYIPIQNFNIFLGKLIRTESYFVWNVSERRPKVIDTPPLFFILYTILIYIGDISVQFLLNTNAHVCIWGKSCEMWEYVSWW